MFQNVFSDPGILTSLGNTLGNVGVDVLGTVTDFATTNTNTNVETQSKDSSSSNGKGSQSNDDDTNQISN